MSEKKIVDDYYSNISNKDSNSGDDGIKKIKVKPKILHKKEIESEVKNERKEENKAVKEPFGDKEVKKIKLKTPIKQDFFIKKESDFNVVKKQEEPKKEIEVETPIKEGFKGQTNGFRKDYSSNKPNYVKKDFSKNNYSDNRNKDTKTDKKVEEFSGNKQNFYKKSTTGTDNKPNYVKKDFTKNTSTDDSKTNTFKEKGPGNIREVGTFNDKHPKSKFINNSYKKKETKDYGQDKPHKNKFIQGGKNKRFDKVDLLSEDISFVRSNKINRKSKEIKNIEDIKQNLTDRNGETVIISDILSLKEFSEKIGISLSMLLAEFMKNGMLVNINSKIDFETASIIAETFNIILERDKSSGINVEDIIKGNMLDLLQEEDQTKLKERPPVISIMGHVDHGKTSLLDYIRQTKVAEGEAGGITQSIGAYQVEKNGKKITFLDTPGHEAFTIMRARGAKSTDIAILVIAADEGVKPQTIESINHAKEAGIPIIVAMNKIDKEGANPEQLKSQLAEHGLVCEEWGGDVPMIPVSAKTGFGIDELLEIIILVSEMKELKANPDRLGVGTVLESHLDIKLGPVATVLVNAGTISIGDNIVCKEAFGKIKVLKDYKSKNIVKSFPGDPILIVGLDQVVQGGDLLQVVPNSELARDKSLEYKEIILRKNKSKTSSLDLIMSKIKSGNLKQLKIVLKADTNGSLEAMKGALLKLSTEETKVSIIHSGVGNITEGDILMCDGSFAILIGFGVDILGTARKFLESTTIEFINSNIIYKITERIEKIITGMLDTKEIETIYGNATVLGIFYNSKEFIIAGLKIKEGEKIENKLKLRVIRNGKLVGKGSILSLKSGVEEVKSLEGPLECGIKFSGNTVLEIGDVLEMYKIEIKK